MGLVEVGYQGVDDLKIGHAFRLDNKLVGAGHDLEHELSEQTADRLELRLAAAEISIPKTFSAGFSAAEHLREQVRNDQTSNQ